MFERKGLADKYIGLAHILTGLNVVKSQLPYIIQGQLLQGLRWQLDGYNISEDFPT